jgi:hypothetical protein
MWEVARFDRHSKQLKGRMRRILFAFFSLLSTWSLRTEHDEDGARGTLMLTREEEVEVEVEVESPRPLECP